MAILHITASAYLLISLISSYRLISIFSNALVGERNILMILYLVSGILGLYAGYEFYLGKVGRYLKVISALAIIIGLVSTSLLFWAGLHMLIVNRINKMLPPENLIFLPP